MSFLSQMLKPGYALRKPTPGELSLKSFNPISTYNSKTKYLIIGTLTPFSGRNPSNMDEGYFYCGLPNIMYYFIDCATDYKWQFSVIKSLYLCGHDENRIKILKAKLKDANIAFLDVVEEAVVKAGSSNDDDIASWVPAERDIKQLFKTDSSGALIPELNNTELKIAANSLNAYDGFVRILKRIFGSIKAPTSASGSFQIEIKGRTLPISVIPQQMRGHQKAPGRLGKKYSTMSELQKDWCDFFGKTCLGCSRYSPLSCL